MPLKNMPLYINTYEYSYMSITYMRIQCIYVCIY